MQKNLSGSNNLINSKQVIYEKPELRGVNESNLHFHPYRHGRCFRTLHQLSWISTRVTPIHRKIIQQSFSNINNGKCWFLGTDSHEHIKLGSTTFWVFWIRHENHGSIICDNFWLTIKSSLHVVVKMLNGFSLVDWMLLLVTCHPSGQQMLFELKFSSLIFVTGAFG